MRVVAYVYDSADPADHVADVLELLDERETPAGFEPTDVDAGDDRTAAERDATLTVKSAVRIGTPPAELFGEDGSPDFSTGALVTEAETGRRSLHVGATAREVLETERDETGGGTERN